MSRDRYLHFKHIPLPDKSDVKDLVEDYFHEAAESVEWENNGDVLVVVLLGGYSHHLRRMDGATKARREAAEEQYGQGERRIEIWYDSVMQTLSLTTRLADTYTNDSADALAKTIARWWTAETEDVVNSSLA